MIRIGLCTYAGIIVIITNQNVLHFGDKFLLSFRHLRSQHAAQVQSFFLICSTCEHALFAAATSNILPAVGCIMCQQPAYFVFVKYVTRAIPEESPQSRRKK